MKKTQTCVIVALIALVSTALAEQTWVEFDKGREGAEPQLTVLESSFSGTTINLKTHGMWVEDVKEGKETYQRITLAASHTGEVGKPMLPVIRKLVAIPATAGVEVNVKSGKEKVFTNYLVYPAQEPRMENEPEPPFEKDEKFYDSDTLYPVKLSEVGAPAIMNDVRLVELVIQPFRYDAKTKKLTVATDLTVYLDYSGVDDRNQLKRQRTQFLPQWERLYRATLLNFDVLYNPVKIQSSGPYHYPGYLIIYAHDFRPEANPKLQEFIDWKTAKGLWVYTTDLNDIAGIDGNPDDADDLKNYIKWWYEHIDPTAPDLPSYILLVGDALDYDSGPPRDYTPIQCADDSHVPTFVHAFPNKHASDYWYKLLAGNDTFPDIALGRWCAEDSIGFNSLNFYVNKTFAYERNPDPDWDCNSALFVADDTVHDRETDFSAEKNYIETFYLPAYYPIPLKQYGDYGGTNEGVESAIEDNGGVGIVNYRGHGSMGSWHWWYGENSFGYSNVYGLDQTSFNGYPVVYNMCCGNAALSEGGASMVELWTRNPNGAAGALGFSCGLAESFSFGMDKKVFNGHFDSTLNLNCGMAIQYAEVAQIGSALEHLLFSTFWIGDPELDVWRGQPQPAHDSIVSNQNNVYVFILLSNGTPVPGVKVCLHHLGAGYDYHRVDYTNQSGYVCWEGPDTALAGHFTVTATKQTLPTPIIPIHDTIHTDSIGMMGQQGEPLIDMVEWQLKPIYPNPLRSQAAVSYAVAGRLGSRDAQFVELKVFDVTGREVKVLESGVKNPGHHEVLWDSKSSTGSDLPSGVYFVRLNSNEFEAKQRLVLLR